MLDAPCLLLNNITKAYSGQVVLDLARLEVAAGQFVALVGASGSGKTTLLKTINGLIVPDAGDIHFNGKHIGHFPGPELRVQIGYVIQNVGLFPHLTIAENIAIVLRLIGKPAAERLARAHELLDLIGLPRSFAHRHPRQLSGGQAQRIGLARALAARPAIMLMDEPFGALDPVTRDELGRAYRSLHQNLGLTTVMVTHDMAEALLLADRIVVMAGGRIVADGAPTEMLSAEFDPVVAALIDVPRRQAHAIAALERSA